MNFVDNAKLKKLHCTFPNLTEDNQYFILGLAEGLKHAQGMGKSKQMLKTPDGTTPVFYNRSLERKICP